MARMVSKETRNMNTYGKPAFQLNSMFNHFNELRHETGHVYDIVDDNNLPTKEMVRMYESSRTIKEFKERCRKWLGW